MNTDFTNLDPIVSFTSQTNAENTNLIF